MVFDEEGNGVVTKAELLKILKANHMASHDAEVARKVDTIMAQADKDGDGVITFDEFVIVSKKFPNILVGTAANAKLVSMPILTTYRSFLFCYTVPSIPVQGLKDEFLLPIGVYVKIGRTSPTHTVVPLMTGTDFSIIMKIGRMPFVAGGL